MKIARLNGNLLAILGLLFGALCWGVIWYPYRLMDEAGVSGVAASFYTYTIAILIGCILFIRRWRFVLALPLNAYWLSLIAGWTNLSYVLAVIDGEVMRVMLLFYLAPLWTALLAHFWLKEKIRPQTLAAIALAMLGAMLMLHDFSLAGWRWPLPQNKAEWLALSAGIGFALTNVFTRQASYLSIAAKCMLVWLGVAVMSGMLAPVFSAQLPAPAFFGISEALSMVGIAIILVAATLFVQFGVTQMSATRASVIFLFELVVAAVAAYYWANEAMTWNEFLGGALIIAAGLWVSFQSAE